METNETPLDPPLLMHENLKAIIHAVLPYGLYYPAILIQCCYEIVPLYVFYVCNFHQFINM